MSFPMASGGGSSHLWRLRHQFS
ncbi:hypothetical protein CGRA01v4_05109 [Colletotrichum graminicola]|nr:hypothetical protein CGRA01v4_05109 [Colletotrichum graminicola]